jgi:hypothetical protein
MADRTLGQFRFVLLVAVLTEGMGGLFKGVELLWHVSDFSIVTSFTFFNFLAFRVGDPFPLGVFTVVAGFTFQSRLMFPMGENRWLGRFCRINGGLQGNLCRAFVLCKGLAHQTRAATHGQKSTTDDQFFHLSPPSFFMREICRFRKKLQERRSVLRHCSNPWRMISNSGCCELVEFGHENNEVIHHILQIRIVIARTLILCQAFREEEAPGIKKHLTPTRNYATRKGES